MAVSVENVFTLKLQCLVTSLKYSSWKRKSIFTGKDQDGKTSVRL